MTTEIQCTEVWGGTGESNVSVQLAGVRGECYSLPFEGSTTGGDIHFLSVCGMSILSKVVIADVSGHGAETAAVSEIIHNALVESIGAHDNSTMLGQVNRAFVERRGDDFKFTTMVSLIIDNRDRSLVYAYAGHPSILRADAETRRFQPIQPESGRRGGIPLGILEDTHYEQHSAQLAEGDVIVVYTDAFSEARDESDEVIGEEGLARVLDGAGSMQPDAIKDHVLDALSAGFDDDATLLIFEVL